MRYGFDAAQLPENDYLITLQREGFEWAAGYIGGHAYRVWTRDEWIRARGLGLELLPIWVAPLEADEGHAAGASDGNNALDAMERLGMTGVVALDVENGLSIPGYVQGFSDALHAGSCQLALYGSLSTQQTCAMFADATWLASWPTLLSDPVVLLGPDLWQFKTGARVDYDICDDTFAFAGGVVP